ncbi:MAG: helix-turn-helix domain-containing protein [Bacteroidales bacterium]|jgi:DNA-binding Lrp family transcriptional regulator|nr:helix-turn-helix domain-containing protein [Bacteroidales bacterium]
MRSFIDNKNIIEKMDNLIRFKSTGTPEDFAKKLNISERKLYRLIKKLKEFGCPIVYNNYKKCYEYEYDGNIIIKFSPKNNEHIDLNKINGGFFNNFLLTDSFWQCDDLYLNRDK